MAVYVDDLNLPAEVPDGGTTVRGRWSHLFADTEDELRAFAQRIGLKPDWIQRPGLPQVHFGVTGRMRQRAIAAGATPATWRQADELAAARANPAAARGRAVRQAAHLYLGHGLHPVPGWAATPSGACCCPRGADCPRPGKHPRAVHTGPGPHDYSWKPLACHTPQQADQRFAAGGPYAAGNLMLAIPPGMLVVDQDDDDGGRHALAGLAGQLGELPATLAHRTPHGVHRIYRTPPGWAGRAWVGKDTRNPLPSGVDLRVPGQILMAPPSQVPAPGGLAAYGPAIGTNVTDLPAAYLAAWTPPQPQASRPRRPVPVPPDRAGAAAAYVHAKISGIVADLASHEPGGRNTAIYTAALKVGSTLGAARTTPGAGHAAAEWTDQAAEDSLMEAAEANGYTGRHGTAAARTAIRSGLRNGLRQPRPLPDFTPWPTTPAAAATSTRPRRGPGRPAGAAGRAHPGPLTPPREEDPGPGRRSLRPAEPGPQRPSGPARSPSTQPAGPGTVPAGTEPPGPSRPAAPSPNGEEPRQQQVAHSWELAGESTYRCTRDGCGLVATRRLHPAERRWLTSYTRDGRTIVVGRVPACGEPMPQRVSGEEMRQLATEAGRRAGLAFRAGDIDRACRLLTDARALDPARQQLWDARERQIRAYVAAQRPRQVSHDSETAPCPQCGNSSVRPVGETYPCLACETQARLTAAGLTPGNPEVQQIANWNRAVLSRADRQPETPPVHPQAEAEQDQDPETTADAAAVPGEAKGVDREREASG